MKSASDFGRFDGPPPLLKKQPSGIPEVEEEHEDEEEEEENMDGVKPHKELISSLDSAKKRSGVST